MEIETSISIQIFESDGRSEADFNLKFRWLILRITNCRYYLPFLNDQIGGPYYIALADLKNNFYFGFFLSGFLRNLGYSKVHVVNYWGRPIPRE